MVSVMDLRRRVMMQGTSSPPQPTNLIDPTKMTDRSVWWAGTVYSGYAFNSATEKIPVTPGATYYLNRRSDKGDGTGQQQMVSYFGSNQAYISQTQWIDGGVTKTIPDNVYYIGITVTTAYKNDAILIEN